VIQFQHVTIESIGYELAPHRVASSWIEEQIAGTMQRLHIPRGRLEDLTGIHERRFWDHGTMPSDIATRAAERAIELAGIDRARIGCIISTSVCRDYIEPSVACLVHGNLGLASHCMNFDISNACLGFLNGMTSAAQLIDAGLIDYALIVDGEGSQEAVMATIRRLQAPAITSQEFRDNFATLTLGSGAVAMVLSHQRLSRSGHRMVGAVTLADTAHNRLCYGQVDWMRTDGPALLLHGVRLAGRTWQLASSSLPDWRDDQIALYAPHQVSARHTAAVADEMGVTIDKMFLNFRTLGNIGPAALPITLAQAIEAGRVRPGDRVGLLGIGSGLNCSMMSVVW